jgi:hypothetical protein
MTPRRSIGGCILGLLNAFTVCYLTQPADGANFGGYIFDAPEPWNSPVLPQPLASSFVDFKKKIPRTLWIGFKKAPANESGLSNHLKQLLSKNPLWKPHFIGAREQHAFMEQHFQNTSLLWAFKAVNPAVGVPHSDMWRLVKSVRRSNGNAYLFYMEFMI